MAPDRRYIFLCLAFFPLVVFFSFSKPWGLGFDFWDTAAAVRELSIRPLHPRHHLYALSGETSPRFNPYTLFWGFLKKITRLGIFTTMGMAGVVNYIIFVLGLYLFISDRYKSPPLPIYAFLTMLWVWGTGYSQANAYDLHTFLMTLPYVGFFAFGLSLNALYFLSRYCRGSKKRDLFLYSLISIVAFVTHPVTGLFCFVAAFALGLTAGNRKRLLFLQAVPLLALGCSLLWPYFSYWELFAKNSVTTLSKSPLFSNQIIALGPAWIGIPIAVLHASRTRDRFPLYGLFFCSLIYVVSAVANIPIGGRFILFSAFSLHLGIALYMKDINLWNLRNLKNSWRSDSPRIILIFILLILPGVYRARDMGRHFLRFLDPPFRIHSYDSPVKPYLFLSTHLTSSDVVLASTWKEGWVIPAVTGARIVEPRHSFTLLIRDGAPQRIRDAAAFFNDPLSLENRISLIQRYEITHILINLKDEAIWHASFRKHLTAIGKEIAREGTIILYEITVPAANPQIPAA